MTNEWHTSQQSQMAGLAAVCGMKRGICTQGELRRRKKSHEAMRGWIQTSTSMHTGAGTQSPMKWSVITALLSQDNTQMTGLLFQHRTGWPEIGYFSLFRCPEYSKEKHAVHIESQGSVLCVWHIKHKKVISTGGKFSFNAASQKRQGYQCSLFRA